MAQDSIPPGFVKFTGELDPPAESNVPPGFVPFTGKLDAPKRSLTRSVGDSAIALGTGVVQGVKMLTDVAGADNAVSRGLGKASDALSDMESPYRKAQKQERATKIKAAEDSGSTWEEVKAHAGAFADAPIDTTLNAIGTSVPTLATAAIPGLGQAALATRAAQVGVGVAQGVGNIKGQIHETVKQKLMGEGVSESEASQRADAAQAYGGGNMGSIALGGALGGLAGGTGAESAARRLLGRQLAGEVAERAAPGLVRSAVGGVLKEAPMEAVQGGQERLAGNLALQGEGFDVPTWQGVAGQAALEGLASAPMGGGFGVVEGMRARAEAQARQQAEADALRADPSRAWTTEPGAADPNQPVMERAVPPVAPELQTSPGAAGPREGLDFTRDVDTTGLTLEDPAEVARARAATMDFQPTDTTPQWDTTRGAAAQDRQPGLDMPAPEFGTGALGLESRSRAMTPSQQMGIDPAAGPLSKLAASAVDSGLAQEAQFLGATGRELQVRRTGPGVADESNVIDVQGRVVEDRAIGTPRRIEARQLLAGAAAAPLSEAVAQAQSIPNAQANASAANSAPALSLQAQAAMNSVADQPQNLPNGVPNGRQAAQAQQTAQEPAQAGAAPRSTAERAPLEGGPGAAGEVLQGAAGVGRAATSQNIGAQGHEAARAQGTAQAAAEPVAGRPDGWRKSMLKAGPVAKAMGIDPKGKRLAQVVAEIDARDTQTPTTPAPQPAPGPVRLGRDNRPLSEGGKPFKTRNAAGDAKKLQPMMRVVSVEGGYALAEKTPAQLAAQAKAARRLAQPRTGASGEPISAHAFVAAAGGLHPNTRADLNVGDNPRIGNRRLFAGPGRGMTIEQATEMLIAEGYLSEGASHNDAYALIKTSLTRPQYNADGIERIAQAESDARFEDYLAAQEEAAAEGDADPFGMAEAFTEEELAEVGYTLADPALQAEVNALIAQSDAIGIDSYAILDDIARTYADATQDEFNAKARDAIAAAIARGNQDGGSTAAQAAPAAEPAQEPGLTAPTRADIEAQQEARDKAEREEAARQRATDQAASQDENRKAAKKDAVEAAPIEDAGEKIGGARKDRWKERGLNLDDLNAMTEAEGAELATKANVWKPDYDALSEAAEPVTAALVKTIYDRLAAKPKKNTPEGRRQYVQMMHIVRDVLTEAKGPEAVRNAYLEIRKRAGLNAADPAAKAAGRELMFSVYKGRSDPFVLGYSEMSKAKKMVEDGFPAKADPWKSRLSVSRMDGGPGTTERGIEIYMERSAEVGTPLTREQILAGFYRVNTKDSKTVAFAPTKADAEAAAATVYERDMKGKKDGKPEPVRPNLDELKRENLPQRIDRDVTSEDFVRDLGFRGVEFGNWSAQDERQRILNMAYDGLMDLAEIMGVPPKAMSLNGTLGMAFGARGGGRFAAHYEPGKLVINMTKIRGGGSMAHEWAHAMDHYFGELDKPDAYTTQARGASGWYTEDQYKGVPRKRMERVGNEWKSVEKMRLDNLRPEMAAAFDEVMRVLFQKQITKAEMVRSQELDLERTEALVAKEQDAEMKAMYQRMAENKREALEELRADPEDRLYDGRGRSDYASQAQALSGKSVDGYWVRPTEMFARAFESWVFDRVTAMGARSDYLVHGVEEDRFAGGGYKGNPYPTGEERARINAAFDKLAKTIKTKDTEAGTVAMFSRSPATKTAYEARIDALFAGEKPRLQGARVLDRSDMLAFLGFGDGPVNLSEGKVVVGKDNHPHMTAAVWKKIPEWLENPALVFDSDTTQGRLVFIAPEMVNGSPVRIIVEPNAAGGVKAHLLVNAYDAKGGSFRRWESDGLLRYVDRNKYAHVSGSFQPQLAGLPGDRGRRDIVTDKQYNGWRRANTTAYSQEMSPELANTLLAIRRPATKESVRAAVRELVNGLGLLPNRLGRVVVATAAEIQQDWEPLIGPVQLHAEQGGDGAAQGFYDPNTRTVFLIADHIRQGDELGVVAHELMHKHGQAVLGEEGWNRLHGAIEGWASAPEGSQERRVYDEAAARVRQSRPTDAAGQEYSSQELFPYAVQVALEQGVRPNLLAKPGTVARWLGQVKAALRDVWSKIVGKPESFSAQDLVNLAFGIAQRENPEHARELDGAANGAPEDRVGSTLLELGRDERLYQYPKSDSKDIVQIGAAKDLTVGPVDRNASESDAWMLANTTPEDGDGVQSWMVRLPNGKSATITDNKGQVYINVSAVGEGGGGSRVYDLAANYALNNGAVFVGDPNGVSASAMRRRLENMLSSAIKYGTTDHLAPHPDQVAGRDGVAPLEWTPGDTLGNIESMVKASVAATEATNPLATSYVRFEPQTRSFDIDPDYGGRSGQVAQDLSDLLDFDGRKVGLGQGGRRTVQRAVFFRALLSGVGGRRSVLEAFRDEQGRGSARFAAPEEGTTDQEIFYSRSVAAAPAAGDYTPAQQRAAEHAFGAKKKQTLAERAQVFRANLGTKLRQGLVDQFAPLKEVSDKAYMLARMSKGSDGAVEAALLYGKVFLRDGAYDVDIKDGGFAKVLASLKGEHDRFFQWVAAQRAERLKAEGKENLLTDQDITALRTLNAGKMTDGSARMPVYAAALRELNAFNESALKVAMESGLIDQAAFDLMKDQPYVPFYRLMEEDGGMRGPRFSSGLVNQQAWKKLKGGTQQINADLVQNTLLNWSHLYGAAARNRASLETMAAAEKLGIAYQVPADTKGAVKVMRDGVAEHWAVEDPYLLDAISAMSYAPGGIVKAMAPFKRLLTFGVTVNPTFKIRNLIRDSLSAIAQSDLSYNPLENVAKGWTATSKESQTYASMLASGGIIKFGTQEDSGRVRTLIEKLGGQVLDQDGWSKLKGQMRSLWETYEEFGDRTENVNRAALYERLVAKGHSHAEASFMARDLMDFSMSGKWEVVRFLTQTVPFLNARMQGLYKLGRAAKEDPRRFAAMAGAVSLASLGLLAAYGDDDDWKKREDWDRDNYWWFKIGTMAFRIPKPFEVGAIGTVAERTAELMMSDEMTGKRFGQRISDMVFNTFAMDPTPQFIKPFIDIYANKDSFSGRPIEGLADERLRPQDRYNERTSEVARLLGSWGLPDPVRLAKGEYSGLSPKQIDFLLRGYFGWIATVATTVTDAAARPMLDRGERPAMRLRDTFLAGNFLETLPTGSSRYVSAMYEQARDVEQAWASYQAAVKSGDMDKAREIQQDEAPKLRNRVAVEHAKRQIAELGQQAKRIESNRLMPADEKRRRLDELEARKHEAARRVAPTS